MLIEITTTHSPASDLGYLLHKHPDRLHTFDLSFGSVHVYFSEASDARCTAVLQLNIDPIGLVRKLRTPGQPRLHEHYVNDRPYVASSFLSVAMNRAFRSAMRGDCKQRPELVMQALPFRVSVPVLPSRGGERALRKIFEPLGYAVDVETHELDLRWPDWGNSRYLSILLERVVCLQELLGHLYVLLPVMDSKKHYWIGQDEVEKLLHHGDGWLNDHPERDFITSGYLDRRGSLMRMAIAAMTEESADDEGDIGESAPPVLRPVRLNQTRYAQVVETVRECGASSVADVGCGEGRLLRELMKERQLERIAGVDVSSRALEIAHSRLRLDDLPDSQRQRIRLLHGSLTYRDDRLADYEAITIIEVIEHMDLDRLDSFERVIFEFARPKICIVTTPNIEYNVMYENLVEGKFRHSDHRFEWTRQQFEKWASDVAHRNRYKVKFSGIGVEKEDIGHPTQMALFSRSAI